MRGSKIAILLVLSVSTAEATVYSWREPNGVLVLTNDEREIPAETNGRVKAYSTTSDSEDAALRDDDGVSQTNPVSSLAGSVPPRPAVPSAIAASPPSADSARVPSIGNAPPPKGGAAEGPQIRNTPYVRTGQSSRIGSAVSPDHGTTSSPNVGSVGNAPSPAVGSASQTGIGNVPPPEIRSVLPPEFARAVASGLDGLTPPDVQVGAPAGTAARTAPNVPGRVSVAEDLPANQPEEEIGPAGRTTSLEQRQERVTPSRESERSAAGPGSAERVASSGASSFDDWLRVDPRQLLLTPRKPPRVVVRVVSPSSEPLSTSRTRSSLSSSGSAGSMRGGSRSSRFGNGSRSGMGSGMGAGGGFASNR